MERPREADDWKMKPFNILGLTILSAGILVLAGFGLYKLSEALLKDSSIPAIVRWGIVGVVLGIAIILVSLIVERIKDHTEED